MRTLLSEYGRSFATRERADTVARELAAHMGLSETTELTVSFDGVSVITGSFANQFVRMLARDGRFTGIAFEDMSDHVADRIRWAIDQIREIAQQQGDADRTPTLVG